MFNVQRPIRRAAVAACLAVLVGGPAVVAQSIPVETTVLGGSRTLELTSLTGSSLQAITVGDSATAPFVARVTDVAYDRAGYQVSVTMSDLYAYASGQYDCDGKIPSSALSLSFLPSPVSVNGVEGHLQPLWDLTGTIDGALALLLGSAGPINLTATDVAGELTEAALSGAFSGAEDALPVKVAPGSGGAFTAPAAHSGCDPAPGSPATTRVLMDGQQSNLSALFSWVEGAVEALVDGDGNGTVTLTELVNGGFVDQDVAAGAVRTALVAAGVDGGLVDSLVAAGTITYAQLFDLLSATLDTVTSLLGQSGIYAALPQLEASVSGDTPSGTYRGTMTVTLVDVP